jgi:hypothetical protein
MDKSNPPTSFGVFKPVGHVVIALDSEALVKSVSAQFLAEGFGEADLVRYTPQEMINQVDAELLTASPLASIGQDLNLIKAHRELALSGCSFLVVHAPDTDQVEKVRRIANTMNAQSAQRYGVLIVEELIDAKTNQRQLFESPDRGLDVEAAERRIA